MNINIEQAVYDCLENEVKQFVDTKKDEIIKYIDKYVTEELIKETVLDWIGYSDDITDLITAEAKDVVIKKMKDIFKEGE